MLRRLAQTTAPTQRRAVQLRRFATSRLLHQESNSKPEPKPLSRINLGGRIGMDAERVRRQRVSGMLSWQAGLIFVLTGSALTYYFVQEKKRLEAKRKADANKHIGKPQVGGPFQLTDHNNQPFSDRDLRGKFSLMYFGFSFCPDICPEELEKLSEVLEVFNAEKARGQGLDRELVPIFVTCDPARDTPEVLKEYLAEFHPSIIGLTGSYDDIKQTCKDFRVYFSTPPNAKPGDEYLVDHSIFFYLMDPEGNFVDALGREVQAPEMADKIRQHMRDWRPAEAAAQPKGFFGGLLG